MHKRNKRRIRMVLTTQYHAELRIGDENLCTKQPIAEFWVKQGVGFCERWSARGCVTEFARFSQRSYVQFLRGSHEKAANSGILGKTRREVLHERERTSVRDRAGTVLTTQYHAKLRIGDQKLLAQGSQ